MLGEVGRNEAERRFERYLRSHGYDYEYEVDLGVPACPDFVMERNGVRLICEVKGFETPPRLQRRMEETDQPVMASTDEVYGPMRSAVREAAHQLRHFRESGLPLVVVLSNPLGLLVHLDMERLTEAMFGNPQWAGRFDEQEGQVDELAFEYGRDGRLRNDHPYISAVAILREVDLEEEHRQEWREEWRETRPAVDYRDGTEAIVRELEAEQAAWDQHREQTEVPQGTAYAIEVLTTGSPEAVALPEAVFDCRRDHRVDVVRTSP